MAASALSAVLLLPDLGGDANSARRSDDEERQGQKQQDGEDLGEVSLTQSTLPRRAASRSRSPSSASAVPGWKGEALAVWKRTDKTMKQCALLLESLEKEETAESPAAEKKGQILLQMKQLNERETQIAVLLDKIHYHQKQDKGAQEDIQILLSTQGRALLAFEQEIKLLKRDMGKDDDEDTSGSRRD